MTNLQKLIKYIAIGLAIFLIVSIFMGIFKVFTLVDILSSGFKEGTSSMQLYAISDNITELEINIGAAELTVSSGESFSLSSNLQDLKVEQTAGCLAIKETRQFGKNYNGAKIHLTVPSGHTFEKVSVSSGAGKLEIHALSTQSLALNLGAGQTVIHRLDAGQNALISAGAGEVTVSDGALRNLDLDLGIGKVTLKSRLSGECEINQGVGQVELALIGSAEDYRIHVEKGVGDATVDGQAIKNDAVCGTGETEVEISGSIGSINVRFTQ